MRLGVWCSSRTRVGSQSKKDPLTARDRDPHGLTVRLYKGAETCGNSPSNEPLLSCGSCSSGPACVKNHLIELVLAYLTWHLTTVCLLKTAETGLDDLEMTSE